MKIKINPLGNRVLINRLKPENKIGSLILPDSNQEKTVEGIVKSTGPGKKDNPMNISVGDRVLFFRYSGTEIKNDESEDLVLVDSQEILAKIDIEDIKCP